MIIKLNEHNLVHEIAALGVHPASVGIFASKSRIIPLKIMAVRTPAANILKQEMLAAGGDCAVPANCILNNTERMDVVLLGTVKHYRILARKLAQMNFFRADSAAKGTANFSCRAAACNRFGGRQKNYLRKNAHYGHFKCNARFVLQRFAFKRRRCRFAKGGANAG